MDGLVECHVLPFQELWWQCISDVFWFVFTYLCILVGFLKVDLARSSLSNYICGLYFFSSSKFRGGLQFSACSPPVPSCLVGIAAVFLVLDLIFALHANKDLMATQTKPNKYIHILLFSHFSHFHKTKKKNKNKNRSHHLPSRLPKRSFAC